MKEQERQRIIRQKLVRMEQTAGGHDASVIPTGFPALDAALGIGGFPRGRIVELFGPASSGKTTLALQVIAHAMEDGASAAWIDAEHVFDAAQAARLGVAVERMPLARPDTAEQALEMARRLAASGALDLLVIDSAAALVPRLELETGLGDSGPGLHSRVLASGLRRLAGAAARSGSVALILNQTRARGGAGVGGGEASAGGPPLKLYAAVRIELDAARGSQVRFHILKNKAAEAFMEGKLRWENGWRFAESP
jgi:recombination protein RecA